MGIIVNSAASTTRDTGIDIPHSHLNLNLNLNQIAVFLVTVGGTTIPTQHYKIVAVLQPLKVKEEDG